MPAYLLLSIAIIAEVVATNALKASEGFTKPGPAAVVVVGYGVAFFILARVMDQIPVGVAYAIWAGGGGAHSSRSSHGGGSGSGPTSRVSSVSG